MIYYTILHYKDLGLSWCPLVAPTLSYYHYYYFYYYYYYFVIITTIIITFSLSLLLLLLSLGADPQPRGSRR